MPIYFKSGIGTLFTKWTPTPLLLLSLILLLSLSACTGWRLRGSDTTALQTNSVYLQGESSPTYNLIQQRLSKKQALTNFNTAQFILIVNNESFGRRTASVNSAGRTAEYELTLTIDYQILDEQQVLQIQNTVRVNRSYSFDPNDITGKDKEELIIKKDMRIAAARQILQQIQLLQRKK